MLCLYHMADHDGKGSAAIVKRSLPKVFCSGYNYDMDIPYDLINKNDEIIICDVSLPMDYMFELNKTKKITWIDHHVSAIEKYNEYMATGKYDEIPGIRQVGTAAIMLTWQYYHPNEPAPEVVELLGLNDVFDLRNPKVRPFEYAVQSLGVNRPEDSVWDKLLSKKFDVNAMVEKGQAILDFIKSRNFRLARGMSFISSLDGFSCICANMARGYSEFFDSLENIKKYDVMVLFYMNKQMKWNLSFYSENPKVDCSVLAAKFGGGGHAGAAGASSLDELPEFLRTGEMWKLD